MKKRMLITTIAMVVVIAVALTTSSLAWFTTSSTVKTTELTVNAASATGADLSFGALNSWDISNYANTIAFGAITSDTKFFPIQGNPDLEGLVKKTGEGSEATYAFNTSVSNGALVATYVTEPFFAANVVDTRDDTGASIDKQVVTFEANASGKNYYASGFNVANKTMTSGITSINVAVSVTITAVADSTQAYSGDENAYEVSEGYACYAKIGDTAKKWYNAGDVLAVDATNIAKINFYKIQDLGLLASLRFRMMYAKDTGDAGSAATGADPANPLSYTYTECNQLSGDTVATKTETYGCSSIKIQRASGTAYNYIVATDGANNNKYVKEPDVTTPAKYVYVAGAEEKDSVEVIDDYYNMTTGDTPTAKDITAMTLGECSGSTISATFNFQVESGAVTAAHVSSVLFCVWMDGWDESCIPGASAGSLKFNMTVSGSSK